MFGHLSDAPYVLPLMVKLYTLDCLCGQLTVGSATEQDKYWDDGYVVCARCGISTVPKTRMIEIEE